MECFEYNFFCLRVDKLSYNYAGKVVLFYQFYDVGELEFHFSKDFCFVHARLRIKSDKTIVISPQAECSAFGT